MATPSEHNIDKILVQIKKSKTVLSNAAGLQLKSPGNDTNLAKDEFKTPHKDIVSFVVQTSDNLGIKHYGNVRLTRVESVTCEAGLFDKTVPKQHFGEITSGFRRNEKQKLSRHGGRHITFFDSKSEQSSKTISSSSLLAESNSLLYYFNYEGKLSAREVTTEEAKKMDREHCKITIALSILDEVFSKIGTSTEVTAINKQLEKLSQVQSGGTINFVAYPDLGRKLKGKYEDESSTIKKSKEQVDKLTLEHKIKGINVLAKELKLPSKIFRNRLFLDTGAKVEEVPLNIDTFDSSDTETIAFTKEAKSMIPVSDRFGSIVTTVSNVEESPTDSPFEPRWCFGFNSEVQVVNLSTDKTSVVLFANAQFPVIYDFHEDTMHFMQGHRNKVSCLGRNSTGSLLVTADSGSDSRVIIWDSQLCTLEVLENVHPRGTMMAGLSASGEYLVTVSPSPLPLLQLWVWRKDKHNAVAKRCLTEQFGEIVELVMNPDCEEEFSLTFQYGIHFFYFNEAEDTKKERLLCDTHQIHQLPCRIGSFTDTMYMNELAIAFSATSKGYVIVWVEKDNLQHTKQYNKHVRLHLEEITHIEVVDRMIAVATVSGNIRLYDSGLKFLWASKEQFGTLVTMSFNLSGNDEQEEVKQEGCGHRNHRSCAITWRKETKHITDATLENKPLYIRQFVFCTKSGKMAYFNPTKEIPKYMLYPSNSMYTAIDVKPQSSYFCAGTSQGQVILFDFQDYQIKVSKQLPVEDNVCQGVSFLRYSSSGHMLACAMYSGKVWLLDPLLLTPHPEMTLSHCVDCITHVVFSPRSDYLAVADVGMCVTVYCLGNPPQLVGQYQAHTKIIRDIMFLLSADNLQLFTLGADRNLVEFQIVESKEDTTKTLKFVNIHRVEQTAIPCCIVPYSPDDKFCLMVNSEMKFKILDTEMWHCCKTIQAPNLGSSITFLKCFTGNDQQYLLFGSDLEIGLHILPPDGNPYKALSHRVSPTRIICCKIQADKNYMFTISEDSSIINMWKMNTVAVEQFHARGGTGLTPFLCTLNGGKGGWQEKDLQEFFLFGQFVHQGERPDTVRTLSDSLQVCEVILVFQALGFFPTKYQIDNILYEVLGTDISRKHQADTRIKYDEFVKLYVNHRPCQELTESDLHQAFRDFYEGVYFSDRDPSQLRLDVNPIFNTESFVEKLVVTGEAMTLQELHSYLNILVGDTLEQQEDDVVVPPLSFMPKEISFETFFTTLLGFKNNNYLDPSVSGCLPST